MKLFHFWNGKDKKEFIVFVDDPETMDPGEWSAPGDELVNNIDIPEGLLPTSFPTNCILSRYMG